MTGEGIIENEVITSIEKRRLDRFVTLSETGRSGHLIRLF
jgi:hypothetical protein